MKYLFITIVCLVCNLNSFSKSNSIDKEFHTDEIEQVTKIKQSSVFINGELRYFGFDKKSKSFKLFNKRRSMISFNYETDFGLSNEDELSNWISRVIKSHNLSLVEINFIFMDDEQLHKLNVHFLNHDTLTDVISFDYTVGNNLQGDIYISIERVADNAKDFEVSFKDELHRVIIHGVLHFCGFKDKTEKDAKLMRKKEDEALALLSI